MAKIKIGKILFVDDDNVSSFLNISLVEELGISREVKALNNAAEALEYIQQEYSSTYSSLPSSAAQDLIFLDIRMPGMDGFELLQELEKIKELDRSRFLIIILSASLSPADEEKAVSHKNSLLAYLTKPLAIEDIQKIVAGAPAGVPLMSCPNSDAPALSR